MSLTLDRSADSDSPKRQAILEAAAGLFIAQGYGAVSMDAVARAAGVSKATLYAHFASKDALFATIMQDGCRSKLAATDVLIQATIACPDDLRTALHDFGVRMVRFLMEPRTLAIYRVVVAETARFPELADAFYEFGPRNFLRFVAGWFADQMRAGWLRQVDPEMVAEQFAALIRGSLFIRASLGMKVEHDDDAVEQHVTAVVDTFLRAYGQQQPAISGGSLP
jgi:TetR/AcrR family transcriptional repressor of mexJK operon